MGKHSDVFRLDNASHMAWCFETAVLTPFAHLLKSCFLRDIVGLDEPMDLTVTASTDNTITLVWGVVQGPIDHYMVTYTSSSGITNEVIDSTTFDMKTVNLQTYLHSYLLKII